LLTDKKISIVVPFHNEEENVPILYGEIVEVMKEVSPNYEMVFVDDKSTDNTVNVIKDIIEKDERVKLVKLRRNFGQTGALAAGFDYATGEIIISMDGDLQHDPSDIPNLLKYVLDGYDIASGWRKNRIDPFLSRKLPSKIANWIMAKFSGVELHDFGTTFKAYKSEVISNVRLYGELHRFIPALATLYGAEIIEVPIKNRKRKYGKSHYNIMRTFRVIFDLFTIRFLIKYITRPLHFFGLPGLFCIFSGGGIGTFLLIKKIVTHGDIFAIHGPLLILAILLILAGIQLFSIGLLGEMLTRTYFESSDKRIYTVHEIITREKILKEKSSKKIEN